MSRLRTIAAIPAGSWTKWVLSTRLMGAEKNHLKYWLAAKPDLAPGELGRERAGALIGSVADTDS
jgi:hypothetical protein